MTTTKSGGRLLTAEEFYCLPDAPEGGKMELAYGRVETMSPVGGDHSLCAVEICAALREFVRPRALGQVHIELGFRLRTSPDLVRAPDVAFIAADRVSAGRFPSFFEGPPTLAVEVVSPDDTARKVLAKVGEYLDAGTPVVWVADPRTRTLTVYCADGTARTLVAGDVLTSTDAGFAVDGFAVAVADLFA